MAEFGIELIKTLKPIKFRYDTTKFSGPVDERIHFGFSAQDLANILSEKEFAAVTRDPNGFYMINYIELISPLVKGLQEAIEKIEELKEEVQLLKEKLNK